MSHYPSTAELANFRTYMTQGRIVQVSFSDHATDAELLRGIGYRLYRSPMPIGYGTVAAIGEHNFRREAGAMRSRSFGVLPDTAATEAAIALYGGW